jgi:hypothetical protein
MAPFVASSFICISNITAGSRVERHEWTLKFVIASFLFHSAVYSSYRYIKGTSKAVPLHVMKGYGGGEGIVPRIDYISTLWR